MKKVSVIIPTFNRAKYIVRAIKSVLVQEYNNFEVIIVDDGSKDNTKELLKPYLSKITYIYQTNKGISAARNRGILESKGDYIAFLDSDDYWVPEKLNLQVKVLDSNPEVGLVFSHMPIINDRNEIVGRKPKGPIAQNFIELIESRGDIPTSTIMTRRTCIDRVGMFDVDLPVGEDTEMWLRILEFYKGYEIVETNLGFYNRHDEQTTSSKIRVMEGLIKMNKKILSYFQHAPKKIIKKNIAMDQYLVAREYYTNLNFKKSLLFLIESIKNNFFIGVLFFENKDGFCKKFLKFIKPYGFFLFCSIRYLISLKTINEKKT